MGQTIRAVYSDGQLKPLEPVELAEGQEVHLTILSEKERVRAALGDLLVDAPSPNTETFDELSDLDDESLLKLIDEGFKGVPPLSEAIIEERREGP
jgi:predicted DNA-binding antitoxin AbrB/MazE fold protein